MNAATRAHTSKRETTLSTAQLSASARVVEGEGAMRVLL
jgi:hypothetical protein